MSVLDIRSSEPVFARFDNEFIEDSKRYYVIDGEHYPSVTTLLSNFEDKSFLDSWVSRVGTEAAKARTEEAANRGTIVHGLIEDYLEEGECDSTNSAEFKKYAKSAIADFYRYINTVAVEEAIIYKDAFVKYAGRIDTIATILPDTFYYADDYSTVAPGLSVIDLKTKDKAQPMNTIDRVFKYALQGSAYIGALEQLNPAITVSYFIVVYGYKTKARCLLFNRELIDRYFNIYYHLVSCFFSKTEPEYSWKEYIKQSEFSYDIKTQNIDRFLPVEIVAFNRTDNNQY